jgi:diguanylate cyclase (GGDEF)-like protein/PAS domain S-box-containing protein
MLSQHTEPEQWREYLESTSALVVVTNSRGEIEYGNSCFASALGCGGQDLQGANIWDLLRPLIRHGALWDPRLAGGPVALREDVLFQAAGRLKWFTVAMDPVFDSGGTWIRTIHIFTDCTLSKVRETVQQKMMEAMASDMPISDVMRIACREFESLAPDVAISILGINEEGRFQTLAAPSLPGFFSRAVDGQQMGPMAGACGAAAYSGEAVLVNDLATDPRTVAFKELLLPLGVQAVWSSPIKARDGRVLGTFAFYYRDRCGPDGFHRFLVDVAIHLCAIALESDASRARIHQLAYFDGLTGLPGRQSILTRLEQAIAAARQAARPLAVVVLNLGHVREINNLFGEGAGDELLCETARRLERCMAGDQIVGRLAGDEFAVILPDWDQGGALAASRNLLSALFKPLRIKRGNTLRPMAAVGISVFPEHGSDRSMLLQGADLAMYHAKQAGGNEIRLFSQDLVQEQRYRLSVEAALREAISGNQLELHYQPKVDLQNGTLWGVEALARWHDPRLGQVPPSSFVSIAEEYGLIDELSHWVLHEACRQLAAWRAKGIAIPVVAINMSPTNFRNARLPGLIDETLAQYGLRPSDVLIEMTEGIFMDATPETANVMEVLRRAGIRLSIDDFGVGYSNLERLRRLPISEIKLDKSFIQNLEIDEASKVLVDAVIQIGKSLDFAVIAEGVEREAQRQILLDHGCRYGQGYLFARPLPPDGVEEWARDHMSPAMAQQA